MDPEFRCRCFAGDENYLPERELLSEPDIIPGTMRD